MSPLIETCPTCPVPIMQSNTIAVINKVIIYITSFAIKVETCGVTCITRGWQNAVCNLWGYMHHTRAAECSVKPVGLHVSHEGGRKQCVTCGVTCITRGRQKAVCNLWGYMNHTRAAESSV